MWVSARESAASAADVSVMQSVFPVKERGGGGGSSREGLPMTPAPELGNEHPSVFQSWGPV